MEKRLYSVEQVAESLGLHVRTVRNYVRDGRLKAVRIGKQYRIAEDDLAAFTGGTVPAPPRETVRRQRYVEVSSVVDIEAVSRETADRIASVLMSAASTRQGGGDALRIETAYDEERARMKVIVLGGLGDSAKLFEYIAAVVES